jgi:diguanylate cyclase (GGDEF)-like protein
MPILTLLRSLLLCVLALAGAAAQGAPVRLDQLPTGSLEHLLYLQEAADHPLTLAQARVALAKGEFRSNPSVVPAFGIGARPVWIHVPLQNGLEVPLVMRLGVGTTWLDHVYVYQTQGDELLASWASGDEAGAPDGPSAVSPGEGFAFPVRVPPGFSEIFIRVDSVDPMILPVNLSVPPEGMRMERTLHYVYGLIYGYLLALIAYNMMVWVGLRKAGYLLYALYLCSFIALNVSYTGHGYSFWWPQSLYFQRYAAPVAMVLFGSCGFAFASNFLRLRRHAPSIRRGLAMACISAMAVMATCVLADWHEPAVWTGFVFMLCFVIGMVTLGVLAVRRQLRVANYFLVAMLFGMSGMGTSLLCAWGLLPSNLMTDHGVEVGVLVESTLLALALARDIRGYEEARNRAELLARVDTLTGLFNRRAFFERATGLWNTASRRSRPLTVAMLDIDHFKSINDRYGHATGDVVLKTVAELLTTTCRTSDVISRWGGEEFLLLLPETTLEQGSLLAERLRNAIERREIAVEEGSLRATVSIGVADLRGQPNLEALIGDADQWLYRAKGSGRNCVMGPPLAPPLPPIMGLAEPPPRMPEERPH